MKSLFLIALPILLITTASNAQTRFERWDQNGDGKLSREELPQPLRKNFDRVDADKDGFISKKEDAAIGRVAGRKANLPANVTKTADIPYLGTDNPRQTLDLYLPETRSSDEPLPVVCWIHGGGWRNGSKDIAKFIPRMVTTGEFAGISIGYRLTDEAQWPEQIFDCKDAIRWIRDHAEQHGLDPERIGVAGSSAGGHLVSMLGVSHGEAHLEKRSADQPYPETKSEVACVVDYFGPSELLKMNAQGSSMDHDAPNSPEALLVGGPIQENTETAIDASPIAHVSSDDAPFLMIHGTEDPLVPYQQSVEFEKALEAVGIETTLITVTGGGHGKGFPPRVDELAIQFLRNHLLGETVAIEDQMVKAITP